MNEVSRTIFDGTERRVVDTLKQTWLNVAQDFPEIKVVFPDDRVVDTDVSGLQGVFSFVIELYYQGQKIKKYYVDIGRGFHTGAMRSYFYQSDPGQARDLITMAWQKVQGL